MTKQSLSASHKNANSPELLVTQVTWKVITALCQRLPGHAPVTSKCDACGSVGGNPAFEGASGQYHPDSAVARPVCLYVCRILLPTEAHLLLVAVGVLPMPVLHSRHGGALKCFLAALYLMQLAL